MKTTDDIWKGTQPPAGHSERRPNRGFAIYKRDFTSVEQAVPVPVVYGRARLSGTQITPIFGFRTEKIETKTGKDAK